jgi:aminopeptidase YwaD
MKFKFKWSFFVFLFFPILLQAQDIQYARSMIAELGAEGYHGRGYVKHGEHKAALFISKQLLQEHLTPFNASFFQAFTLSVNTFPSSLYLKSGEKFLVPGTDYVAMPNSGSCNGTYPVSIFDKYIVSDSLRLKSFISGGFSHRILVVDTTGLNNKELGNELMSVAYQNLLGAHAVVELTTGLLSSSVSMDASAFVSIKMRRNAFHERDSVMSIHVKNKLIPSYQTQNIAGFIKGEIDSFIVFTAHYDHLGMMGKKTFFPGANDNASGTAFLLDLARNYSYQKAKLKYSIAFIFFGAEEAGLVGSEYYALHPLFTLSKIKLLMNFDMVGTGEDGITVVNGTIQKKVYHQLDSINKQNHFLKEVAIRGPAKNSDHYWFHEKGVPAVFIYTRGSDTHYHTVDDKAETLSMAKYNELFRLITTFVDGL